MTMKRISPAKNLTTEVVSEKSQNKGTPRDQYLIEKERIQNEIGNLEQIRLTLGLSQRRVCQLLLVDPSAWTRWNKTDAPPHIFQALKWLIELRKVNPEAAGPRNFESRLDFVQSNTHSKIERLESHIEMLEKAVALTSTVQPIFSAPTSNFDFETFEQRFSQRLDELEARISKPPRAKISRRKKQKTKPKAKAANRAEATAKMKLKSKSKTKLKPKAKPKNLAKPKATVRVKKKATKTSKKPRSKAKPSKKKAHR